MLRSILALTATFVITLGCSSGGSGGGGTGGGGAGGGNMGGGSGAQNCDARCAAVATQCQIDPAQCGPLCAQVNEQYLACMESANCDDAAFDACMQGGSGGSGATGGMGGGMGGGGMGGGGMGGSGATGGGSSCSSSVTFPCEGETCTLAQLCFVPPAGDVVGPRCVDVPVADQCTPCSTQAYNAPSCPATYYPTVTGSSSSGCTVTCQ